MQIRIFLIIVFIIFTFRHVFNSNHIF